MVHYLNSDDIEQSYYSYFDYLPYNHFTYEQFSYL